MTNPAPQWSDAELGFLADHEDWTSRQLALALGRSESGVRQKRRQVRQGWSPTISGWMEHEFDTVRSTAHMTARQVADLLGRSEGSVRMARSRLVAVEGLRFGHGSMKDASVVGFRRLVAKTCIQCGELMDAHWYRRDQKVGHWSPTCGACRRGRAGREAEVVRLRERRRDGHRTRQRFQEVSLPASRHGEPYTTADFDVLADPDMTMLEKALALGRTYKATCAALSAGGYTSRKGLGKPEDGRWKIDNPNAPVAV